MHHSKLLLLLPSAMMCQNIQSNMCIEFDMLSDEEEENMLCTGNTQTTVMFQLHAVFR